MRFLLLITSALIAVPAYAEVYTYDYTGVLETSSLLGAPSDTFHGTFSFDTETPILLDLGDQNTYRAAGDLSLAPKLTYVRDHDGFTINSSDQHAKIVIANDHYQFDDYFLITSQYLQSPTTTIHNRISMEVLLRGMDGQPLSSTDIPTGLPPIGAFVHTGLGLNGGRASTLTSMTYIPPGDLDRDGFVGITDLSHVLANWNQTTPPADPVSDPSGDGFIGIEDLNIVLANWNVGSPPASNYVPEPGSVALLSLCVAALARRRINH